MMRPDAKVEKVYLYPKPVDFRKSIDGLTALAEAISKMHVQKKKNGLSKCFSRETTS